MRGKVFSVFERCRTLGTLAMPPLPEATAQMHWKKKKHWAAKKKWDGGKRKNCQLSFTPGGRKPQRICS